MVKVLLLDRFSKLFNVSTESLKQYDYMFIYDNVFRELNKNEVPIISIFLPDMLVLLINSDDDSSLEKNLTFVSNFLKENYSYETFAAVSRIKVKIEWFNDAMKLLLSQTDEILENHLNQNNKSIVFYSEVDSNNLGGKHLSLPYNEISFIQSDEGEHEEQDKLVWEIAQQVRDSYSSPETNVTSIAYKIGKNIDYVSRVFKQKMGIGLLDYLHLTRIEAAKKLLIGNEKQSIALIAATVGYTSIDSIIRVFKRITGMTPGAYRKAN
jgi:AraC-like DNA-binding protein